MRLLLVDDHDLFRKGLTFLLSDLNASVECVEASSCEQALELVSDSIEMVLLDFHLPGIEGLNALAAIKGAYESAPVVILSGEDDPGAILDSIDHGASGFIPKSSTPEIMVAALQLILAGGIYLPPHALRSPPAAADRASDVSVSEDPLANLSPRQREVLLRVVQGLPNKVVARELDISEGTVKAHLSAAYRELGVRNRTEAVFVAARYGLTPDSLDRA